MDNQELKERLLELPMIPMGTVAEDCQIIEGDEAGCHFKVTKERLPPILFIHRSHIDEPDQLISLSLSGSEKGQKLLLGQFIELLGQPERREGFNLGRIKFYMWPVSALDQAA